ncbi:MAG: hypothetical protein LBM98_08440 [Oscillospiraceae bacterium]|jgi:ribosomal protein S27E|nr:hypothetical protein [Oscillospiraceae bacterium]
MNWLRNFMRDRYGPDQLSIGLIVLGVVIGFIMNHLPVLNWFAWIFQVVFIALAVFRMLSRDIISRQSENAWAVRTWYRVRDAFREGRDKRAQSKTFKFFKCPACRNVLRVPRGKGSIRITCPKCGEKFTKNC